VKRIVLVALVLLIASVAKPADGQVAQRVVDIPTRPGVTQRFVLLTPREPKAAVVLFAGGHGGLQISDTGRFTWGEGNFLVRSRQFFAERDLIVAVVDAPSDRQSPPYLGGFRQTQHHVADIKGVIAWLRKEAQVPVWLVGTSRGTQSAGFLATQLTGHDGPDGLVLTSTVLRDNKGRPVPDMSLGTIKIPVLVVHHEQDGCSSCLYSDIPRLMERLAPVPRKELFTFKGGVSRGDPCEAFAYHGYNGLEREVVAQISGWIIPR